MRLSQEMFDDVVKENMDEFDMDLEEAMKDAVQQFQDQGYDLSCVVTTIQGKKNKESIVKTVENLNKGLEETSVEKVTAELELLISLCSGDEEKVAAAGLGAIGAATFVCKTFPEEKCAIVTAFKLLEVIFSESSSTAKSAIPKPGFKAMLETLNKYAEDEDTEVAQHGFRAIASACLQHEDNKRSFHSAGINVVLIKSMRHHSKASEEFSINIYDSIKPVLLFTRRFISDDDRREGVQPNTFVRAREIGENKSHGVVRPLIRILDAVEKITEDRETFPEIGSSKKEDAIADILLTLKHVAVNDLICKHISKEGGLDLSMHILDKYMQNKVIVKNVLMTVRTVSRNDDIKLTVGKGDGLPLVIQALETHILHPDIVEQAMAALSVLSLRQSKNCDRISELGSIQLITAAMEKHSNESNLQRQAISTLRNMVSQWQNKDLVQKIIDEGAERLIRDARASHPVCDEVAYAALRDLGLPYTMTK